MKKFLVAIILALTVCVSSAFADTVYFHNSMTNENITFTNVTVDYNKSSNIFYIFDVNKKIIFHAINVQVVGILSEVASTNSKGEPEKVPLNWYVKML